MRRLVAVLIVPILLLLGVVAAPPALADVVDGGILTSGQSVTGTVSVPGQDIRYTFAATSGLHVMFDVTATSWGAGDAMLGLYRPDGTLYDYCPVTTLPPFCEITPPVTGTWGVVLNPVANAVGSTTFTYTADQSNGTLIASTPVTTAIAVAGQGAKYSFTATAGVHLSFGISATNWGPAGSAQLYIFSPAGTLFGSCADVTDSVCEITPISTGTWTISVDPVGASLGSTTFALIDDQTSILTPDIPVTTTIATAGQKANYGFTATKGAHITFAVTAADWGTGGSAGLRYEAPNGASYGKATCPITRDARCEFFTTMAGMWTVTVDPVSTSLGSTTFVLVSDQNKGTLTSGRPVTTTITTEGQNANYSFAGTKGNHVTFDVTATNWGPGGSANLYFYQPNGTLYDGCLLQRSRKRCEITPDRTGRWRVILDPVELSVGGSTFTYAADQKGRLIPGTPITTTITSRGQDATYTLKVTNRRMVKLTVKAAHWNTGGSAWLYVFPPGGRPLFTHCAAIAKTVCAFTPNRTGSWKVRLDPSGATLGNTRIVRN